MGTRCHKGPNEQLWGRGGIPTWVQASKYDQPQMLSRSASYQRQQTLCCISPCSACPFWAPRKTLPELRRNNPHVGFFQFCWRLELKPPNQLLVQTQCRNMRFGEPEQPGDAPLEKAVSLCHLVESSKKYRQLAWEAST